jgi:hypothetical protein
MCPKDAGVVHTAWFPDEDICLLKDVPDWVKRQRKIAKTGADPAGYFTLPMLEHHCVIGKAITGLDPNAPLSEEKNAVKAWLEKHPEIKPISEEKREKARALMASVNANRTVKVDQNKAV